MSDNKLFVITNKESNLSGVIRNIDENNVEVFLQSRVSAIW